MKKTDWTDRMLAALVELYPVETTAYTAAVLNLSESTVKLKARELGLVKMAKSRWMERADYIRNHFQECSFSEIGKALGITRMRSKSYQARSKSSRLRNIMHLLYQVLMSSMYTVKTTYGCHTCRKICGRRASNYFHLLTL